MDQTIKNKARICIWGVGHNARVFAYEYKLYYYSGEKAFVDFWDKRLVAFVDNDANKTGKMYEGKPIVSYSEAVNMGMDYCIITVDDSEEIENTLQKEGYLYMGWRDYLKYCKEEVLSDQVFTESNDSRLSSFLRFSRFVESGMNNIKLNETQLTEVVGSLAWYFGDGLSEAKEWLDTSLPGVLNYSKREIKTIGIIIDRYYGGGIERTTSNLIKRYTEYGYHIILITDEQNKEKEYSLPSGVSRCNLEYGHDTFGIDRLSEIKQCIEKNMIDLVMFHTGYARLSTFYEVLLIKLMKLPVVIEIRSSFIALLSDQKKISERFKYIYQLADRVVALSDMDCLFWNSQGCRTICIPNPVEKYGVDQWTPRSTGLDDPLSILWVGRIVQSPKQILDVVPIMRYIVEWNDRVTLRIVGGKDNDCVYDKLVDSIIKNGLTDNIEVLEYQPDISNLYKESDVILLTSASESYSNVIVEAKVYSRPIVMYELPWLVPVDDGKGIISVKQRDTRSAAEAIVSLLDNKKWEEYSIAAWNSAQELVKYDCMERWNALFSDLQENREYERDIPKGLEEMTDLLLDQLYDRGYPYSD